MSTSTLNESILVEVLHDSRHRSRKRVRLKLKRMSENAFAFFRGGCGVFARDWKEIRPREPGPEILLCGDLHLENFGAYRDVDGEFLFDINDFDESLIGPSSIDPVRCATSILLAAELWNLSPLHANRLVLAYLDEYRTAVRAPVDTNAIGASAPRLSRGPIWEILGKTALGTQSALLDENTRQLKDGTRRIVRSRRKHPPVGRETAEAVFAAVEAYGQAKGKPDVYRPIDVTGRIAGIGSLGVKRFLVLVAGGGSAETNQLLDIKEERPSVWLPFAGTAATTAGESEAARVVRAQQTLQARPTAGLDVLPLGGIDYRVREMIPEENRSNLDRFQKKPAKLYQAIVAAGHLTGLAHLRSARASNDQDATNALVDWANGSALDSLLAAAARCAERTRLEYKQFRAERKAPAALPEAIKAQFRD